MAEILIAGITILTLILLCLAWIGGNTNTVLFTGFVFLADMMLLVSSVIISQLKKGSAENG